MEVTREFRIGGAQGLVDIVGDVVSVAGEGGAGGRFIAGVSRLLDFVHLRDSALETRRSNAG